MPVRLGDKRGTYKPRPIKEGGLVGVSRTSQKLPSGNTTHFWKAYIYDHRIGKILYQQFAVAKHGEARALELAIEARAQMEREKLARYRTEQESVDVQ